MARIVVALESPIMFVTASYRMCIAGDGSGSLGVFFYAKSTGSEGKPRKRALVENQDVASGLTRADFRSSADRKRFKFPLEPQQYYVIHGVPYQHHESQAAGRPLTTASLSVVHCRPLGKNMDELTHHFLECALHHAMRTGAKKKGEGGGARALVEPPVAEEDCFFACGGSVGGAGDDDEDAASDML